MADTLDSFEEAAAAFYKATGKLMPGKSVPAAMNAGEEYDEERRAHFKTWCAAIQYMHRETGVLQTLERELAQAKADLAKSEAISGGRLLALNEKAEEAKREWARAERAEADYQAMTKQYEIVDSRLKKSEALAEERGRVIENVKAEAWKALGIRAEEKRIAAPTIIGACAWADIRDYCAKEARALTPESAKEDGNNG